MVNKSIILLFLAFWPLTDVATDHGSNGDILSVYIHIYSHLGLKLSSLFI